MGEPASYLCSHTAGGCCSHRGQLAGLVVVSQTAGVSSPGQLPGLVGVGSWGGVPGSQSRACEGNRPLPLVGCVCVGEGGLAGL